MKDNEEQEELVDIWDGIEVEEDLENPTDEELEEQEDLEEEEESEESEEDTDEEEVDEVDEDLELDLDEEEDDDSDEDDPDSDEEVPLVQEIQERLGYDFDEEFEDTEEGIQKLVESASEKLADETIDAIFREYPDVKELLEYRSMGGDPNTFFQTKFPEVDYSEVEFNEEDGQQHETLVRRELNERGYTADEIEAEVQDYKNGGILENKAKRALSTLQANQEKKQQELLEQQREQHREQQKQIEEYWQNVEETINNATEFKGLKIPSKEKDPFFRYISAPIENGMSQRDIDVQQADQETRLAIDYLLYKGFDLSDIVDMKAKQKNAKTLRKRMKSAKLNKKQSAERKKSADGELEEIGTI